jgi:hypothetical protein
MSRPNSLGFNLKKMPNVQLLELFGGMEQLNWFNRTVQYVVNSKYRTSVGVKNWLSNWEETKPTMVLPNFGEPSDACALACTRWVAQNIKYVGDMELWQLNEHWGLPDSTLALRKGDCEDGAMLLYFLLRSHGFPDSQIKLVAGYVQGPGMKAPVGHCYVSYISSENAVEYVLDWCYWPNESLIVPYGMNPNYLFGRSEWFAFNLSGSYVRK